MNLFTMPYFRVDCLSSFIGALVVFFGVIIAWYSLSFMKGAKRLFGYYVYIFLTILCSLGAVFANNLVLLMVFWGFLGMLLYLLIGYGRTEKTTYTAKKAFIIIGGTDAFMLLGLAFVWKLSGSVEMDKISIAMTSKAAVAAYLCLAAGALAKAGAMPFHTWVPDMAEDAPVPVTALLPASLDKLVGIYLLTRLSLDIFRMSAAMNTFLMVIGSVTIVAAVMMALVQHDMKRLLGYHAVSQVGYMVLGIGTANPIGIAGGLFHMLNNAIYKSALFLSGGAVEKESGTSDLDRLGGYAKFLPISFIVFLIASLAISGVPPFNGFVSKWMIYQGIIETGKDGSRLWIVWLVAAMFGSALTLASFMKLIHAIFLGQPSAETVALEKGPGIRERSVNMWVPGVILATLCVVFGVAYYIPLKEFLVPSVGSNIHIYGLWTSGLATVLLIAGVILGLLIYFLGSGIKVRRAEIFVGGEEVSKHPDMRVSGTEFYRSIQDIGVLRALYGMARRKMFDIYEVGTKITFGFNGFLRFLHNGVLSTYLTWCLLGMLVLFYVLMRKP
ncbi:MAG: proton-conducting transporter membrane subunit [Candidatus Omnitrophota bacterium]